MKTIGLLGSTGSIGRQTLDIARAHKDQLQVYSLAAGKSNLSLLADQVVEFQPELVSVPDDGSAMALKALLSGRDHSAEIEYGDAGLIAAATVNSVETLVTGLVGFLGLKPTAAAICAGKTIALANKETLVAAGSVIMPMVKKHSAAIVPVDSEHSAIFQSLAHHESADVNQLILTGSGGPFRTWSMEQLKDATVDDALKHPNWSMGPKITCDSATLMNKGLEIIEARWLFDISPERIKVVIHPQSILHSAVEFVDGSIVGQMGLPDMRLPIHYALFYPERVHSTTVPRLDLIEISKLTFEEPDTTRFPCLALAKRVAASESTLPCVLNAANEIAVNGFLNGHLKFMEISQTIERVIDKHSPVDHPVLEDILEADRWARQQAQKLLQAAVN